MTTIPIIITIELLFLFWLLIKSEQSDINTSPIWLLISMLLAWMLITAVLGYTGTYTTAEIRQYLPGYWLPAIPVVIVFAAVIFSRSLRVSLLQVYRQTPAYWMVTIHIVRLAAIGGLYKAATGQFTVRFAYSVGIPDLLVGLSAVVLVYLLTRGTVRPSLLLLWHLFGATAILLPMYGLMPWFVGDPTFYRLFEFPMSMAPTFIVPLLVLMNLWCAAGLWLDIKKHPDAKTKHRDNPGIVIPPPIYVALVIGLAYLLGYLLPLQMAYGTVIIWTGYAMVGLAIVILFLCAWQFYRHETDIRPHKPDSSMIIKGPYRFSRNPIYLSFLLFQLGYGLIMQHGWILVTLPLSYIILRFYVIANEEAYLLRRFGEEYQLFCRRVDRWITTARPLTR